MTCNFDGTATPSSLHAPIEAGGQTHTNYTNPSYYSLPDDWQYTGPMFAYMAACPGDSCEGFDGSGAVWPGYTVTIPKNLKPGNYLIRHEAIQMRSRTPMFSPDCAQLAVSGEGTALRGEEYLVSFPGAYSLEDPGLTIADSGISVDAPLQPKWNTTVYAFPGPAVWHGE
ncbi:uncharacterized protein BP5553_03246 [Venustampulla echinocandica]|uniref:AA9 family lytic polysaccharide monooxygenase n=1 Tax=Venustampulla echinocandica TaxID=2656787 RepID=A0A370TTP9_9HELO|nr:uncharacterized protein BP5553_03246 [Venustampulla echinocandica]RDL38906.1 hypothetical protein BP5553_03246 [Venustampulla echinocandica]